ncbi:hypothetical protein, partial [Glycomyces tenuis]|uniref:hypothetical protein n=1 Tax=Glycomyces tenuis TaxID=58116 RepID=UPI001B7FF4A3
MAGTLGAERPRRHWDVRGGAMRRMCAGAAAMLLVAAGCSGGDRPGAAAEPTWSVACEQGEVPVEPLGELSLP